MAATESKANVQYLDHTQRALLSVLAVCGAMSGEDLLIRCTGPTSDPGEYHAELIRIVTVLARLRATGAVKRTQTKAGQFTWRITDAGVDQFLSATTAAGAH